MSIDSESLSVAAVATKPDLLQEQIKKLTEQVAALSMQVTSEQRKPNHCYNYSKTGLQSELPVSICCQMFSVQ